MKNNAETKKYFSVVINFVIVTMLLIVASLTLNFESQYVFGINDDEAIYNGNRDSNYVTLMINVYWGTEYVEDILEVLNAHNAKTTFFVGGTWVEKEQELFNKIYDNGHEIGNHGYFHKDHDTLSYDQNYDEINVTHALVKSVIGIDMTLFAPPSGAYDKTTLQVATELGYKTIMWSRDTIDWRDKDSGLVFTRATKNVKGGDLVLMHPTAHTLQALPNILQYYADNGLDVVPVSQNISG